MITQKFKEKVALEVENIKKFATKREIPRLSKDKLNPNSTERCIYGMMTGDCHSTRAVELLNQCAVPYSHSVTRYLRSRSKKFSNKNRSSSWFVTNSFSPIEYLIFVKKTTGMSIIDYLKGNTLELVL